MIIYSNCNKHISLKERLQLRSVGYNISVTLKNTMKQTKKPWVLWARTLDACLQGFYCRSYNSTRSLLPTQSSKNAMHNKNAMHVEHGIYKHAWDGTKKLYKGESSSKQHNRIKVGRNLKIYKSIRIIIHSLCGFRGSLGIANLSSFLSTSCHLLLTLL